MGLFGNIIPWFKRGPALNRQTVAMEQLMKGNALWGANPDTLVTAVTAYHAGNIAQLAKIVDAYERQDDVAATGRMKRDASVARCEHTVLIEEGHEDDPRAQLHRETLQRFWATIRCTSAFNRAERGGIRLLKKQMMSARTHGWSAHNILWHTDGGALRAEFVQIPMWHFENLTGELRFREHVTDWYGVPLWDGGWLINSATPIGPAVALACCAKRMSLHDWMLFSERAATPGLLGKTAAAPGTEAWNNLCEMLRRWSRAWTGAVDKDTDITPVNLNTGTPPMPQLVERMDRAIAALYRGADLSTISKGEGLGASLQGEESDMLESDQCAEISEALHEQVDRLVIRFMCGDDEPLAYIWIEPVSKPDVASNTQIDDHLAKFGIRLSKRDMLQRYGRAEAADDADALEPPAQGFGDGQSPSFGALPNERRVAGLLQTALPPFKTASKDSGAQRAVSGADAPEGVFRAFAEAVSNDAKPLADQVKKLLDLIDAGKEAEAASFAATLSANLSSYLPEDPESATVLAEAMAERYGQAWEEAHTEAQRHGEALHNEITKPCKKCHHQLRADGGCTHCERAALLAGGLKKISPNQAKSVLSEPVTVSNPTGVSFRFTKEKLLDDDSHLKADHTGADFARRARVMLYAIDAAKTSRNIVNKRASRPNELGVYPQRKEVRKTYTDHETNKTFEVVVRADNNGEVYEVFDIFPR